MSRLITRKALSHFLLTTALIGATLVGLMFSPAPLRADDPDQATAQDSDKKPDAKSDGKPASDQPQSVDEIVRDLFIAMMTKDKAAVEKLIVPNPKAAVLWQGESPPAEVLPQIVDHFKKMTCRECKVGETIQLPGNKTLKVTDQFVSENKKLVFPTMNGQSLPTPLPLVKIDDQWKVDAAVLIIAREAAQKAREKNGN
jgi:hypothetical protein